MTIHKDNTIRLNNLKKQLIELSNTFWYCDRNARETTIRKTARRWNCGKCNKEIPIGTYALVKAKYNLYCLSCGKKWLDELKLDFTRKILKANLLLKELKNNTTFYEEFNSLARLKK